MKSKNNIKKLRQERGMTQQELADVLGVKQNTLSCWERGVYEPDNEMLWRMAKYFNVSVEYLIGAFPVDIPIPELGGLELNHLLRLAEAVSEKQGRLLIEIAGKMVDAGKSWLPDIDLSSQFKEGLTDEDAALVAAYHAARPEVQRAIDVLLQPLKEVGKSSALSDGQEADKNGAV